MRLSETGFAWLITRRSQVQILPPLLRELAFNVLAVIPRHVADQSVGADRHGESVNSA